MILNEMDDAGPKISWRFLIGSDSCAFRPFSVKLGEMVNMADWMEKCDLVDTNDPNNRKIRNDDSLVAMIEDCKRQEKYSIGMLLRKKVRLFLFPFVHF